jgi:hypothetical protein
MFEKSIAQLKWSHAARPNGDLRVSGRARPFAGRAAVGFICFRQVFLSTLDTSLLISKVGAADVVGRRP